MAHWADAGWSSEFSSGGSIDAVRLVGSKKDQKCTQAWVAVVRTARDRAHHCESLLIFELSKYLSRDCKSHLLSLIVC